MISLGIQMKAPVELSVAGSATKITNLGALKIVLGIRRFLLYLLFVMAFSFIAGIVVNIIV